MSAVPAPAPKVAKVAKKSKTVSAHPPFAKMIVEAIADLKDRNGSSRQAILKHIKTHHNVDEKVAEVQVRRVLVSAVKAGKLIRMKGLGASGSFKVSPQVLEDKAKKTHAAKKPKVAAAPKKTVAKKPAAKKTVSKAKKPASAAKPKKAATPAKPKVTAAAAPVVAKQSKAAAKPKKPAAKPKKPVVKKTPKKVAPPKK